MIGHSRSTSDSPIPSPWFKVKSQCDQCGLMRTVGNHTACSKKRQAIYARESK